VLVRGAQPLGVDARTRLAQARSATAVRSWQKAAFAEQRREALAERRWEVRQAGGPEVLVTLRPRQKAGHPWSVGLLTARANVRRVVVALTAEQAALDDWAGG
jgi:hypothetical protein